MARRKNGHLVRERTLAVADTRLPAPREPEVEQLVDDPRQLQLELAPTRARFVALEVEGDGQTVAAALQLAGELIGGRHG